MAHPANERPNKEDYNDMEKKPLGEIGDNQLDHLAILWASRGSQLPNIYLAALRKVVLGLRPPDELPFFVLKEIDKYGYETPQY